MENRVFFIADIEGDTSFQDVTLLINNCVCDDWEKVDAVIPVKNFVGWNYAYPGDPAKCYKLCVLQLKMSSYSPTGKQYQIATEKNKQILFNKQNFNDGIDYLKKAIKNKIPVLCGVDDKPGTPNKDTITDHFVIIVGMGSDSIGNYFLFFDNAVSDSSVGASSENKLYCFCSDSKLEGVGDTRNGYIQGTSRKKYTVSRIVTSVKIK
jgi:hypothetical protein